MLGGMETFNPSDMRDKLCGELWARVLEEDGEEARAMVARARANAQAPAA